MEFRTLQSRKFSCHYVLVSVKPDICKHAVIIPDVEGWVKHYSEYSVGSNVLLSVTACGDTIFSASLASMRPRSTMVYVCARACIHVYLSPRLRL